MDLSVNKIKSVNNLKFKGIKSGYDTFNEPVYKFYAPPFDSKNEIVTLQIAPLYPDKNGKYLNPSIRSLEELAFNGDEPLEIEQKKLQDDTYAFAYRYKIATKDGKQVRYVVDSFKSVEVKNPFNAAQKMKMNVINQGYNYGITPKTGPMRHSFIDSDAVKILNKNAIKTQDKDFVRNHFNKLGGSLKGLTYLLKETDEFKPYRYIISTPDIGVDKISSHGYWPVNQYQCTNMDDFKEFVFEMYKQGKGYVADGAFTSQGIESPLVQHVLKWGKESPFYNMLKIDSYLQLGILPDRTQEENIGDLDYIAVKVVNTPYDSKEYDKNKPTYIQFFDTRLTSDSAQESNSLIKEYDKYPEDHYDIVTHQDSITPYYFEIAPDDDKLKLFKNGKKAISLNSIENLDDFLTFKNFKIVSKNSASGANFWDGNRDIIKMNLSNPSIMPENRKGFFDARNYLYGVAKFWTETVQSDLILKTALMSAEDKRKTAEANGITKEEYDEIIELKDFMTSNVLEQNKTALDYIKDFPLQSIETSSDLSAIFSEPEFNSELLDNHTLDTLNKMVSGIIKNSVPDNYKNDSEYIAYVTKTLAMQVIKDVYVSALCPKALNDDGTVNLDILKDISLISLGANDVNYPSEERKIVINKIRNGLHYVDTAKIQKNIKETLKNISLDNFKISDAIVTKGKAGLNWRFDAAKDIGDLDSVRDGLVSFDKVWKGDDYTPGVEDFWTKFVSNIKDYNPSAYIIAEITCLHEFAEKPSSFDKKLGVDPEILKKDRLVDFFADFKEAEFLEATGSTTGSNYGDYFNNLSKFIGIEPEHGGFDTQQVGDVNNLKSSMENVLRKFQPNTVMLTHMFTDNHDKPRLLHASPINMVLYLYGHLGDEGDKKGAEKIVKELIGDTEIQKHCPPAVAVGLAMYRTIDKINFNDKTIEENNEIKDKLKISLKNLVNGYKGKNKKYNPRRALAFGTLPYEVTIRDMFKGAGIEDDEMIKDFHYLMLKDGIKREVALWEMMNAIVGTPTIYNGAEFFQTGYETSNKNKYLGNRGQILHELKDDRRYKPYYDKLFAISNLYKSDSKMSAIRDGFPILMDKFSAGNVDILPIFKYNGEGSKVLTLITNNGLPKEYSFNADIKEPNEFKINGISVQKDNEGLFEDGTKIKRKIYKNGSYVDDGKTYVVDNKFIKVADSKGNPTGEPIELNNLIEYFYQA